MGKHFNLVMGILLFFGFTWDIEHQRSVATWFILLASILNIMVYFAEYIIEKINK